MNDKIEHFVGCAFITWLVFFVTGSLMIAAVMGMGVGIAKEVYDSRKGGSGFDVWDLFADLLGVIFSAGIILAMG